MGKNQNASISVIVPSFNTKAKDLTDLFGSLFGLDYSANLYEIIVVDDGSKQDNITEALHQSKNKAGIRVQIVRSKCNLGPSSARNLGAQFSRADILAFTDSDAVVEVSWLQNIAEIFSTFPEASAISGPGNPYPSDKIFGRCEAYLREVFFWTNEWTNGFKKSGKAARGGNFAVRRRVFISLGGFDATLRTKEDHEFAQRILDSGGSLYFSKEVLIYHKYRENLRDIFYQSYFHAIGDGKIAFLYPKLLCKERVAFLFGAIAFVTGFILIHLLVTTLSSAFSIALLISPFLLYIPFIFVIRKSILRHLTLKEKFALAIVSMIQNIGWCVGFLVGIGRSFKVR